MNEKKKLYSTGKFFYYNNNNDKKKCDKILLFESEIITNEIINKIIDLVVNFSFVKNVEEKSEEYIFNYLKRTFTPMIKIEYMDYDIDNNIDVTIKEPKKICIDTYLLNKIESETRENEITEIKENKTNPIIQKLKQKIGKIKNTNYILTQRKETSKKMTNRNFESYSIKDFENNEEPEEIQILREEVEEKLKKIRNEKEKNLGKIEDDELFKNKQKQIIDSEKYTFDSNGKLINRNIKKMNDLKNEFYQIIPKTKFIKLNQKEDDFYNFYKPLKDNIKIERNTDKNFLSNELLNEISKNLIRKNIIKRKYKFKNIKTKIVPVKNEGDYFPITRCEPSGDNFTYIKPQIGVLIKSKSGEKGGNFEYSKLYKRYSNNEYNNILEETIKINKNKINSDRNLNENKNLEMNNNLIKNYDDNSLLSSSSNNSNQKINNFSNKLSKVYSDRISSCNQIILSKSIPNNSSLLDSVDDYENISNTKIIRKNASCKKFFLKKMVDLKIRNKNKELKEKEHKTFNLINKFNLNLVKNQGNLNEKELLSQRNKQILPELKPVIPKYSSFVKRNGILVKCELPLRINYGKNHSGIL